eukprot:gb/GFBE01006266.1/.p1 GENE.gb/GFBE01006266.1/~~gb/GFBE01006266.1/.p1  ORF type:complete len:393 (+),score=71.49 gb/GFBE01006266.1/:1-1179(+)
MAAAAATAAAAGMGIPGGCAVPAVASPSGDAAASAGGNACGSAGRGRGGSRATSNGAASTAQNPALHAKLVQQVKLIQRSSEELKADWHKFCDEEQGGIRDPVRHDAAFLQRFLMTPQAAAALASFPQQLSADGEGQAARDPMHPNLVSQVKRAQRNNFKEAWRQHCDAEAGGMRDPGRHTVASLRRFLGSIDLPPDPSDGTGRARNRNPSAAQQKATDMMLVEKVKTAQRTSSTLKDLWRSMCDAEALGVYDPLRHSDAFLSRYLESHGIEMDDVGEAGGPQQPGPVQTGKQPKAKPIGTVEATSGATDSLVQRVKLLQRTSEAAKKAWHGICDLEANGVRDPARHNDEFLSKFVESVAASVQEQGLAAGLVPKTSQSDGGSRKGKTKPSS